MQNLHKLDVWKIAHALTLDVDRETGHFPPSETFALTRQLRRSSASIGSNIAEGTGRPSQKDLRRFLGIARASCVETEYQLLLARDLGYLSESSYRKLIYTVDRVRRMLTSLRRSIATT